jgi:hypothetical protein
MSGEVRKISGQFRMIPDASHSRLLSQKPITMNPEIHIAAKKMLKNIATLRLLSQTAQVLIVKMT